MIEPIDIQTAAEYDEAVKMGFCPLIDWERFTMDIRLRVEIQRNLFGRGVIETGRANVQFYKWCWEHKPHRCEETLRPLYEYSAVYVSHILPRGAYPEMATDPRNVNILCFEKHAEWENGRREAMRIYPRNRVIIDILKREYRQLTETRTNKTKQNEI